MKLIWKINPKWSLLLFLLSVGLYFFYLITGDDTARLKWRVIGILILAVFAKEMAKKIKNILKRRKSKSRILLYIGRTIKVTAIIFFISIPILILTNLGGAILTRAIELRLTIVWIVSLFFIGIPWNETGVLDVIAKN